MWLKGRLKIIQRVTFSAIKLGRFWGLLVVFFLSFQAQAVEQPIPDPTASQPTIHIYRFSPYIEQNTLFFDAQTRIHLPERVQQALLHEIPLIFDIDIEVRQTDTLAGVAYHKTRFELNYQTELSYFNFNQKYLLMNRRNHKVKLFDQLKQALDTLGTFEHFKVIPLPLAATSPLRLELRVRIVLNRWQLPAPLALEALYRSDWDLDSGWVSATISPSRSHLIGTLNNLRP